MTASHQVITEKLAELKRSSDPDKDMSLSQLLKECKIEIPDALTLQHGYDLDVSINLNGQINGTPLVLYLMEKTFDKWWSYTYSVILEAVLNSAKQKGNYNLNLQDENGATLFMKYLVMFQKYDTDTEVTAKVQKMLLAYFKLEDFTHKANILMKEKLTYSDSVNTFYKDITTLDMFIKKFYRPGPSRCDYYLGRLTVPDPLFKIYDSFDENVHSILELFLEQIRLQTIVSSKYSIKDFITSNVGERYDYWIKLLEESVQEFHLKKSGISDDERYEKRREKAIADDKAEKDKEYKANERNYHEKFINLLSEIEKTHLTNNPGLQSIFADLRQPLEIAQKSDDSATFRQALDEKEKEWGGIIKANKNEFKM